MEEVKEMGGGGGGGGEGRRCRITCMQHWSILWLNGMSSQ